MNHDFCQIVGMITNYLDQHPDGVERLKLFLADNKFLYSTEDVIEMTGWGRNYISRLCTSGRLPFIPGKPHKFVPAVVKQTLIEMQIGGQYGRRKAKTLKRRV